MYIPPPPPGGLPLVIPDIRLLYMLQQIPIFHDYEDQFQQSRQTCEDASIEFQVTSKSVRSIDGFTICMITNRQIKLYHLLINDT